MNEFIILMENYGKASEYAEISLNSSGQSMDKFSAYEETLIYRTERFKNSYQEMSETLINSEIIKFFIDTGTAITTFITKIGSLGTIGLGAGLFSGIKNIGKPKMFGFYFKICR